MTGILGVVLEDIHYKTSTGMGVVELSRKNGKFIKVAVSKIRQEDQPIEFSSLSERKAEIRAKDVNTEKVVYLSVCINPLANALGVEQAEIEREKESGCLQVYIESKLKGEDKPASFTDSSYLSEISPPELTKSPKISAKRLLQTPLKESKRKKQSSSSIVLKEEDTIQKIWDFEGPKEHLPLHGSRILIESDPFSSKRMEIVEKLPRLGLKYDEFEALERFYATNKNILESLTAPTYFKKRKTGLVLPRSVVFVPEGLQNGLYVLLKSKGIKELGLGSTHRATLTLHMDSGQLKVFRDGKSDMVKASEYDINKLVQSFPNFFVAGVPVRYVSTWRNRVRAKDVDITLFPREKNVEKVGFIMDLLEGGDLFELINSRKLSPKESIYIALNIVKGLVCLHDKLKIAHLDLKPENIFLTKENFPKIADFGFACSFQTNSNFCGTFGYMAPEVMSQGMRCGKFLASSQADIWSFGCLLVELLYGRIWYNWQGSDNNFAKIQNPTLVEQAKKIFFPNRNDSGHWDSVINACLSNNPYARPPAHQLVIALEKIIRYL